MLQGAGYGADITYEGGAENMSQVTFFAYPSAAKFTFVRLADVGATRSERQLSPQKTSKFPPP